MSRTTVNLLSALEMQLQVESKNAAARRERPEIGRIAWPRASD